MKNAFILSASLIVGFMVSSCQNVMEEFVCESEVQSKLATTRVNIIDELTEEELSELASITASYSITGVDMICGTQEEEYEIETTPYGVTTIDWSYNTSLLNVVSCGSNKIKLTPANSYSSGDITLTGIMRYSDNSIAGICTKTIGVNGPLKKYCTIHVYRASDNVEVYPHANVYLEPNTLYYAYFSSSYSISNLTWNFSAVDPLYTVSYGNFCQFKTTDQGWTNVTVSGCYSSYNVNKVYVEEILYG